MSLVGAGISQDLANLIYFFCFFILGFCAGCLKRTFLGRLPGIFSCIRVNLFDVLVSWLFSIAKGSLTLAPPHQTMIGSINP